MTRRESDLPGRLGAAIESCGVTVVTRPVPGGTGFALEDKLILATQGRALHLHIGPIAREAALAEPGVRPLAVAGRDMEGWVTLPDPAHLDQASLALWVARAVAHVRTLLAGDESD